MFVPVVSRLLGQTRDWQWSWRFEAFLAQPLADATANDVVGTPPIRAYPPSCCSLALFSRYLVSVRTLSVNSILQGSSSSQTQRYQTVHNSFSRLNRLFYPLSHRFSPSSFSFAKNSSVIELMGNTLGLSRVRATKIRGERVWWATASVLTQRRGSLTMILSHTSETSPIPVTLQSHLRWRYLHRSLFLF